MHNKLISKLNTFDFNEMQVQNFKINQNELEFIFKPFYKQSKTLELLKICFIKVSQLSIQPAKYLETDHLEIYQFRYAFCISLSLFFCINRRAEPNFF